MTSAGRHDAVHVRASLPSPATRAGGHSTFPPFLLRSAMGRNRVASQFLSALLTRWSKGGALSAQKNGAFAPSFLPLAWPRSTTGRPRRVALGRSGLFSVQFFAAFRRGRLCVLVRLRVFRPGLSRLAGLNGGLAFVAIGVFHGNYLAKWPRPGGASEKLASEAQRRGRNSVSAVAGVRAIRCSMTIGSVT
jgi:hypothetical protein